MKSLVCISHVPDTTTNIKYTPDGKSLDTTGVTFVIGPYDEYGLVRAIEFKEQTGQGHVTVLCVGGAEVEPTLRKALAIGADAAVRIDGDAVDANFVAKQVAEYAQGKDFDFIFFGKESIATNGSAVPGMVAEYLELPFISQATSLEVKDGVASLHRELAGAYEVLESPIPCVISCQKGLAEWRIPNMRGIMMAKRKPLSAVPAAEVSAAVTTEKLELPPPKGDCQYIDADNAAHLVSILNDKGLI
ncbi:MAG: electron transfer flavoprotein subunit beta/FixA family protein [Bacteroidota bacterium]